MVAASKSPCSHFRLQWVEEHEAKTKTRGEAKKVDGKPPRAKRWWWREGRERRS